MNKIKQEQLDFLDWELGVFFHFGIRTFYEGHADWDMQEMPLDAFNPRKLDCESWIKTIQQAGAKYAILVCKHHDGFANWPSAYTDYSVKNTPWKNGNGDVVREFTDACHKYGIKTGLYYSPADFSTGSQEKKDYDQYFINQITELLSNYGKIDYLWFDGCGSENHTYDTVRIIKQIRTLQPNILIFNMWDPDTRWVGNEAGITDIQNHNLVSALDFSVQTERKDTLSETKFLPVECDCRIRLKNWFYSENDLHTLKSVEELMGLYHYSVGRGANLLLNIAPNRDGLLPEEDTKRFLEFGKQIRALYEAPKATFDHAEKTDVSTYVFQLDKEQLVNRVILEEDLSEGEKAEAFSIKITPVFSKKEITVYTGYTIGHKRICAFPPICTSKVIVCIERESGKTHLKNIRIF